MAWGASEWVAVASAALALASLLLNWAVVRRQTQLQFESLKAQMDAEVLAWAHEVINLVSQAEALARGCGVTYAPDEFRRIAHETAQSLSAAADRGRLFFPNLTPDAHGQHKEAAFQGFRQPILDAVIFSCTQIERMIPMAFRTRRRSSGVPQQMPPASGVGSPERSRPAAAWTNAAPARPRPHG